MTLLASHSGRRFKHDCPERNASRAVPPCMASSAIDDPETPAHSAAQAPHRLRRKQIKWIIAGIVLVALAIAAIAYWRESSRYVRTDDAYVQANQVEVTAQVSGPVTKVYVRDQQAVKSGDSLF